MQLPGEVRRAALCFFGDFCYNMQKGGYCLQDLYLPTLHTFENNNIFTGSWGDLRFKITPSITMRTPKEVDMEASSMKAEFWHGLFCYEKSEIQGEQVFPLSVQGRQDMLDWLKENA